MTVMDSGFWNVDIKARNEGSLISLGMDSQLN